MHTHTPAYDSKGTQTYTHPIIAKCFYLLSTWNVKLLLLKPKLPVLFPKTRE